MRGRRNSLGRFEKTEKLDTEGGFTFPVPKGWSTRLILVVGLIFLISPWIFMMIRNNALDGVSTRVKDFYENYFACNCPTNLTAAETLNLSEKKGKENTF